MKIDSRLSAKEKVFAIAKEVLPLYNGVNIYRNKVAALPDKKEVLSYLEDINVKNLEDKDLMLFLDLDLFVNTAYPTFEKILHVRKWPSNSHYNEEREKIVKKYYSDNIKQFKYHLTVLQRFLNALNQIQTTDRIMQLQIQDALVNFRLNVLLVDLFNDSNTHEFFERYKKLLDTDDYESINTIFTIQIENMLYELAEKYNVEIYKVEKNSSNFVVKQLKRPETVLDLLYVTPELESYKMLLDVIIAILYERKFQLFLKQRYTQALNGKLAFDDQYLTPLLMVIMLALNYLIKKTSVIYV